MQLTLDTDWEMLKSGGFLPEGPPQADLWDVWDNTFDDIEQRERKLEIVAGQPLLLRPDGSADRDVLAYLHSYSFRTLAKETQQAYARDLKIFLSFLCRPVAEGRVSIDWRAATKKTLEDYAGWRLFDDENPKRVSGTRFAREVAALRRFYEWAEDKRLVDRSPVVLRTRRLRDGTTAARCPIARASPEGREVGADEVADPECLRAVAQGGCGGLSSRPSPGPVVARAQ